ncbi:tetratricopeptide repeat protein [Ilumatobacteraceae bacterium]|nr:tetratricopeptide repeat protein [Ilumatobacteraceae bacterium]
MSEPGAPSATVFDVTDADFESAVLERSQHQVVVVDLWAPWCGPCTTLGPLLEEIIGDTGGSVVLAKVNVDESPAVARAFQVQSIPAVYAVSGGQVVDGFVGAQGRAEVQAFVDRLGPSAQDEMISGLIESRDELGLRAVLETEPGNEAVIVVLAELLVERGESEEALALLERVPETDEVRRVKAEARLGTVTPSDDYDVELTELLDRVKGDDEARQRFVDILELMGPDDSRTAAYRRQLTARLF